MYIFFLKVFNKFYNLLRLFLELIDINNKKFFKILDKKFDIKKNSYNDVVLFDHFNSLNHQLIRSLLLNSLSNHFKGNLVCFNYKYSPFLNELYKIINVKKYIKSNYVEKLKYKNINQIYKIEEKKIKSKKELMNYKFKGFNIGIDIYETYLIRFRKVTIDLSDKKYKKLLLIVIKRIIFWENYFKKNKVKAISITHRNYLDTNLICKVGYKYNVPVFTFGGTGRRIGRFYDSELNSHIYLKKYFQSLKPTEKKEGINFSKKQIKKRFRGKIGVDMKYSEKSAFTKFDKNQKIFDKGSRIKVLICTHCFYDNPHAYGGNLFTDFYEWLTFLSKISHKTNYDWYIKPHPDYLPGTIENIKKINKKFKRIKLLDPSTSFHQLAQEGLGVALTVYGSVAHELPLLGIDVINADINNPHCSFDFSHTPKNLKQYKKILLNLKNIKSKLKNKNQIYEFYYIYNNFLNNKNLLFRNYDLFDKYYLKDYKTFYKFFINKVSKKQISNFDRKLKIFFNSDYKYLLEKYKQKIIYKYEKY